MDFYIYVLLFVAVGLSIWWSLLAISGLKDRSANER